MKKILLSSALCATMMFAANSEYKYEVTPMVGGTYTEGNLGLERNYANAGLAVGFNLDDSMFDQVELGFLRSVGDVKYTASPYANMDTGITRVFSNVIKEYELSSKTSLYALIGAGFEWFDSEAYGNKSSIFGNYGFGIKYKITDDISLKADVRHLIETDDSDNNLLYTVGLAIPFGKKAAPAPMAEPASTPAPVAEPVKMMPKDSDGDGVVDSLDKCPDTPKGEIVDETGCTLNVDLNINFETDSAVINNSYDSKIKKFADFMKAFPSVKGKIAAHTDSDGSDAYNQKLSERRAASAVKALEAYGVEASRLNSIGYGETKPKASNATAEGKAMNRRVEGSISK
ncbi:MAG: OmpA family protein [Arcobacter sp.]|nr:MAG: OmpA family protein [Arcobacter sp.]